jgi:hypothetical protein
VLELHIQPHPELLEIAPEGAEVDPERGRDGARLVACERALVSQVTHSYAISFD